MRAKFLLLFITIWLRNDLKEVQGIEPDPDSIVKSVHIDSSDHAHIQQNGVKIWRFDVAAEGCDTARVRLDSFLMNPGDYVLVYGLDTDERPIGMERFEKSGWRDRGEVVSVRVWAKHIVVEFHAKSPNSRFHLTFVHFADCHREEPSEPKVLCSKGGGWENIVCLKASNISAIYPFGDGVFKVRSVRNGTAYRCTGWKATDKGYLLGSQHCIRNQAEVSNTEVLYKYQTNICNSDTGKYVAKYHGDRLIQAHKDLDFTIFTLKENVSHIKCLSRTAATPSPSEAIYIIHHPKGKIKKVSYKSNADPPGHFCRLQKPSYCFEDNDCYNCDTDGSSSGAPVIFRPSKTGPLYVFSLHRGGDTTNPDNCPNVGAQMSEVEKAAGANLGPCSS